MDGRVTLAILAFEMRIGISHSRHDSSFGVHAGLLKADAHHE